MNNESVLRNRCHVNSNNDGDRFVGIKGDSNGVKVYFPIGFQLGVSEIEIKKDILLLLSVLTEFCSGADGWLIDRSSRDYDNVDFPLVAFLTIIDDYMNYGVYIERDPRYKTSDKGNINWAKTFKTQKAMIQKKPFSHLYKVYC